MIDAAAVILIVSIISIQTNNGYYLSLKNTNSLKGILAILVVFHHLALSLNDGMLFHCFSSVGYLLVAVFFFLSGYGLIYSYYNKENYLNAFWKNRILKIIIEYIIVTVLYSCYFYVCQGWSKIDFQTKIKQFSIGDVIAPYSWFVIAIILFYITFYFSFVHYKKYISELILLSFIVLYIWYTRKNFVGTWWYDSCISFYIGVIWYYIADKSEKYLKKYYLVFTSIIVVGSYYLNDLIIICNNQGIYVEGYCKLAISSMCTIAIICSLTKLNFSSRITYFLGNISFEIYILQAFGSYVLRGRYIYI